MKKLSFATTVSVLLVATAWEMNADTSVDGSSVGSRQQELCESEDRSAARKGSPARGQNVIVTPLEVISEIGTDKIIYETISIPRKCLKKPRRHAVVLTLTELRGSEEIPLGEQRLRLDQVDVIDANAGDKLAIIGVAWDTPELNSGSLVEACAIPYALRGRWRQVGPETCEILEPIE